MDNELKLTNDVVEAFGAAFETREKAIAELEGDEGAQTRLSYHIDHRFLGGTYKPAKAQKTSKVAPAAPKRPRRTREQIEADAAKAGTPESHAWGEAVGA